MKRLVPFLILAFCACYLSGSRVVRPQGTVQISASHAHCAHYPQRYLPLAETSDGWDMTEQPLSPPRNLALAVKPFKITLFSKLQESSPLQKHYSRPGHGCGGLPS